MRPIKTFEEKRSFYHGLIDWKDASRLEELGDSFERIISKIYQRVLKQGDLAVDIGAGWGLHTLPMADIVGPTGKVMAFDPLPLRQTDLKAKAAQANLSEFILSFEMALSNYSGRAKFIEFSNLLGYSSFKEHLSYPVSEVHRNHIEVEVHSLDQILKIHNNSNLPLRFIKADIEGGEYFAFLGAIESIKKYKPIIAFENTKQNACDRFEFDKSDFFQFFNEIEYQVYDLAGVHLEINDWEIPGPWYSLAVPKGFPMGEIYKIIQSELGV